MNLGDPFEMCVEHFSGRICAHPLGPLPALGDVSNANVLTNCFSYLSFHQSNQPVLAVN